jgi:cellobiose-specific phosphotransferase system component IIC
MNQAAQTSKENLEKKVTVVDRAKFMAGPGAATVASYFGPELKAKYESKSEEVKAKYQNAGLGILGTLSVVAAAFSGYKLFKSYKAKKEIETKE